MQRCTASLKAEAARPRPRLAGPDRIPIRTDSPSQATSTGETSRLSPYLNKKPETNMLRRIGPPRKMIERLSKMSLDA